MDELQIYVGIKGNEIPEEFDDTACVMVDLAELLKEYGKEMAK